MFQSISAITLGTRDMAAAVQFYESLGLTARAGATESFVSYPIGPTWLNLIAMQNTRIDEIWGRVIIYVDDVDALYDQACRSGYKTEGPPSDAPWGERYFHIRDPDGHELSFAKPL